MGVSVREVYTFLGKFYVFLKSGELTEVYKIRCIVQFKIFAY